MESISSASFIRIWYKAKWNTFLKIQNQFNYIPSKRHLYFADLKTIKPEITLFHPNQFTMLVKLQKAHQDTLIKAINANVRQTWELVSGKQDKNTSVNKMPLIQLLTIDMKKHL